MAVMFAARFVLWHGIARWQMHCWEAQDGSERRYLEHGSGYQAAFRRSGARFYRRVLTAAAYLLVRW